MSNPSSPAYTPSSPAYTSSPQDGKLPELPTGWRGLYVERSPVTLRDDNFGKGHLKPTFQEALDFVQQYPDRFLLKQTSNTTSSVVEITHEGKTYYLHEDSGEIFHPESGEEVGKWVDNAVVLNQ